MEKLNTKKSYGTIYGGSSVRYFQDGKYFNKDGKLIEDEKVVQPPPLPEKRPVLTLPKKAKK
jgi:hypothetical protein